jgi:hypothetical protein
MLRRILRSLPRSSQASQIFRQRTIVAPRPSFFLYLGVSVATFATIITIHGDATPPSADQSKKLESPVQRSPSQPPSTEETFDMASESGIPENKATGISRIDTIVLGRYATAYPI